MAADQTVSVGKPTDADGDKVAVEFVNNGQNELVYDEAKGVIIVAKSIKDGSYNVQLKLKDNNASPLQTTYSVTIQVSHKMPDSPTNSTDTKNQTATVESSPVAAKQTSAQSSAS